MSDINTPFPVDETALGDEVGPIFFRGFDDDDDDDKTPPPPCLARGLVNGEGKLIPTRETQVVKIEESPPSIKVFALLGKLSTVTGSSRMSMTPHAPPATALSVTFSNQHLSSAVFGPIERVIPKREDTRADASVYASHGIHALFEDIPVMDARQQSIGPAQQGHRGCSKVYIRDTTWTPAVSPTMVTRPEDYTPFNDSNPVDSTESKPFFCCNFVTGTKYVQFRTYSKNESIGGCVTQLIIKKDNIIEQIKLPGMGNGTPSEDALARGRQMLLECDKLLETNMPTIQSLETVPQVNPENVPENVFNWLNKFQRVVQPKEGLDVLAASSGMQAAVIRLLKNDPTQPERLPVDGNSETRDDSQKPHSGSSTFTAIKSKNYSRPN